LLIHGFSGFNTLICGGCGRDGSLHKQEEVLKLCRDITKFISSIIDQSINFKSGSKQRFFKRKF